MKTILIIFALIAFLIQIDAKRSDMLLNLTQLKVDGCTGTPND